jgi:glycosyltransferase involved in cell wall biosynthesis
MNGYKNKFKIVIPSYNNHNWVGYNIASILNQSYDNYEVLYIDDASIDGTGQLVQELTSELQNWKVVFNKKNMRRGYNISPYNENILTFIKDPEDILVFIDGDDWLYDEQVLEQLNSFYNTHDYWMTYGGMVCYPSGKPGYPQNTSYDSIVHTQNLYRRDVWRASHLRTFKWKLYNTIKLDSLLYKKTGEYYFHAEDLATSFPCLEMCPQDKIGVLDFYSYVFNESPDNRVRGVSREVEAGTELELEIRNQTPYSKYKL